MTNPSRMRAIIHRACVLLLFGAGAVCVVLAWSAARRPVFSGTMRLQRNDPQRLLLRRAAPKPMPADDTGEERYFDVPGNAIRNSYPQLAQGWVEPGQRYDAVLLPFSLVLTEDPKLVVENRCFLETVGPQGRETQPVMPGDQVALGDETLRVEEVRRFAGVFPHAQGEPMVEVSLKWYDGVWMERICLGSGRWIGFTPDPAVHFRWVDSLEEARRLLEEDAGGLASASWGVVAEDRSQWVTTFLPGSRVVMDESLEVLLLAYEEEHPLENGGTAPAIQVEVNQKGERDVRWCVANDPGPVVQFDFPGLCPTMLQLFAWEEGHVLAAAFRDGVSAGEAHLATGESWAIPGGDLAVRLEAALAAAAPIMQAESRTNELVLQSPTRRWRLREGEPVRSGDEFVEFTCETEVSPATYHLQIRPTDGSGETSVVLEPGMRMHRDGWIITGDKPDPWVSRCAVLRITQRPRSWPWNGLSALFLLAAIMVLFGRTRKPRGSPRAAVRPDASI